MKNKYNLKLGIVIIGYSNVNGIKRLLSSLNSVVFGEDELKLIFSIDYSGKADVTNLANAFIWDHGEKIVKAYENNLGLRTHILKCGDYIDDYDLDAIIVLEDDIFLSPNAYNYALEAINYYRNDNRIAGISLYKHEYNINAKHPFIALNDGYDTFFMQYAQSWGQIWLRDQWHEFKKWYQSKSWEKMDQRIIPDNLKKWQNSWLKFHIMYCIDTDSFFVYPHISLTTDFSDAGVHGTRQNTDMQVPLDYSLGRKWNFASFDQSKAVYDAFFQNIYVSKILSLDGILIDYYGIREIPPAYQYVLSTKSLGYKVINSWGLQLRPIEANIILGIDGHDILLYDLSKKEKVSKNKIQSKIFEYDLKGLNIVSFSNLEYCFFFVLRYFKNKMKRLKKKKRNQ